MANMYEAQNIMQFIKGRKIEWLSNITRMPNCKMLKNIFLAIMLHKKKRTTKKVVASGCGERLEDPRNAKLEK